MRAAFVGISLLIMFFHLLPLETTPRRWAAPDLLVCLCFAWALRRPDYVPALAVAGVMLLADLMFQRPPGSLGRAGRDGGALAETRANGGSAKRRFFSNGLPWRAVSSP